MLRKNILAPIKSQIFQERGKELHRVEALSDAVFAFSVSLLVASLEVPQTFHELLLIAKGALPFFATVTLLFLFWYQQHTFFRRFGLHDRVTVLLNLAYLAVILFYVYPLKFLFSLLLAAWTGIDFFPKATEKSLTVIEMKDFPSLVILFSIGYLVIWSLIFFMHKRAKHFLKSLQLSHFELLVLKKETRGALWNAAIGAAALMLASWGIAGLAGICYLLIPVVLLINHLVFKKQVTATERKLKSNYLTKAK